MADLETRVAVLEAKMDGLHDSGDRLMREITSLHGRVSATQDKVDKLTERVADIRIDMEQRFADMKSTMEERFTAIHKEFAVVHREIANQTKFLLVLALASATVVSILHPLFQKLLR